MALNSGNPVRYIDWLLFDGQSNSVGGGGAIGAPGTITTSPLSGPLGIMLNTGIATPRTQSTVYTYSLATGFAEAVEVQYSSNQGETPATRTIHEIIAQRAAAGEWLGIVGSLGIGSGGLTIDELTNAPPGAGAGPLANSATSAINGVTKIVELCANAGYVPRFHVVWLQGEAQYTNTAAVYSAALITRLSFYDDYLLPIARTINQIHAPFQMLVGQLAIRGDGSATEVGEGQYLASQTNSRIWIGYPLHPLAKDDNYHISEIAMQFLGAQLAKSFRELTTLGYVRQLRMVSATTTDNLNFVTTWTDNPSESVIEITDGPLILSDSYVAQQANKGFIFSDGTTTASSVAVTAATQITVTASTYPAAGTTLKYAKAGAATVPNSTGNVTDSRTGASTYDPSKLLRRAGLSRTVTPALSAGSDPGTIAGLVEWFRADTGITKDGSNRVSSWTAKTGTSSFAQATAGKQWLWQASVVNSQNGLTYSASRDDVMPWTGTFPTTTFSVVAIIEDVSGGSSGDTHVFSSFEASVGRRYLYFNDTQSPIGLFQDTAGTASRVFTKTAGFASSPVALMAQSYNHTSTRKMYVSGQGQAFIGSSATLTGTYTPPALNQLGGTASGTRTYSIFDLFIFNTSLHLGANAIDFQILKNYAAARYGFVAAA